MIRDFEPGDYERVKALHEASGADYVLPPLLNVEGTGRHPLFVSAKVLVVDGTILLFMGARMQAEMYLIADKSKWHKPAVKMACIQGLDKAVRYESWLKGIDEVVSYVPPTMKRFVKRITDWLGYRPPREGWTPLSRSTK